MCSWNRCAMHNRLALVLTTLAFIGGTAATAAPPSRPQQPTKAMNPAKAFAPPHRSSSCGWQVYKVKSPGHNGGLTGVAAIATDDVWAVGSYVGPKGWLETDFFHFDGTSWTQVSTPGVQKYFVPSSIAASSSSNVWVVGGIDGPSGQSGAVAHWDGSSWQTVQNPAQSQAGELWSVAVVASNYVVAVGYNAHGDGFIEHFDGSAWTVDAQPPTRILSAVAGASTQSLWAAGGFRGFLKWDQSSNAWTSVPGKRDHDPQSMSARSDSEVWAVTSNPPTVIERWNGSAWRVVPFHYRGVTPGTVSAVSSDGSTWITGLGSTATFTYVFRYDGGSWHNMNLQQVGYSMNLPIVAGVPGSTDVWVAGQYTASPSTTRRNLLERWTCS